MESFSSDASFSSSAKTLNASSALFYPTDRKSVSLDYPHVLIVDDDPLMRHYLGQMFNSLQCSVTMTESSFQTLGFIFGHMKNKPKLNMICMKYNMSPQSGLNGYQMLVQMKRPGSPAEDVPVVIYCPDPTPAQLIELNKCVIAGASMVLRKSPMLAEVLDMVKRFRL